MCGWNPFCLLRYKIRKKRKKEKKNRGLIAMVMAAIMVSVPLSASALLTPTSLPPPKRSSLPRNSCSIAPHLISSSSCSRKLSSYSASTSYLSSGQIGSVRCRATGEGSQSTFDDRMVYQGVYGPWTVDSSDIREVRCPLRFLYPFGLTRLFVVLTW